MAMTERQIKLVKLCEGATGEELQQLRVTFKTLYTAKEAEWCRQFGLGQQVTWQAKGRMWTGVVTHWNARSVGVDSNGMKWTVHPSFLTVVS